MSDYELGFFWGIIIYMLFDSLIINFVYLSNCDMFLDLILFKKQRNKLITCCINRGSVE